MDPRGPTQFSLTQTASMKNDDSNATQGLQLCQREPSERRGQDGEFQMAPLTTPVMWSLTSGDCTLQDDGCLTTANFPNAGGESSCNVSIDPEWTGFLFVEYLYMYCPDLFHVDGELVAEHGGQLGVHGMAPRSTLSWSPTEPRNRWKLCQVNALPPWRVTSWWCYIDREGCFESRSAFDVECYVDECIVEFAGDWELSLDVVDAHLLDENYNFNNYNYYYYYYYDNDKAPAILTVNGQSHVVSSDNDFFPQACMGWWPADFRGAQMTLHAVE